MWGPAPKLQGLARKEPLPVAHHQKCEEVECEEVECGEVEGGWSHSHDIGLLVSTLHVQMLSCREVVKLIFNIPRASGTPTLVTIMTGPVVEVHTKDMMHHTSNHLCGHLGWWWGDCWLASQC